MTIQCILKQLDQNGATGLDLSPGDPLAKEAARIIRGQAQELNEVEQVLGKALGYPELYEANDEKGPITCGPEYPGAKPTGTVYVGDHVAGTLAQKAANRIKYSSDRPKIACLCGSSRFKNEINAANKRLTLDGKIVISLGFFGQVDAPELDWSTGKTELKTNLDELHKRKMAGTDGHPADCPVCVSEGK